ncbi:MAG: HPr family phosphocarrier protein [Candidatus Krumholzibacteriota bacterium]|nr:HPr family phosphocarrier protein [Candidatus Krumholzibacteriota bacterium]
MVSGKVKVTNTKGIHLRLASELVKAASKFRSNIMISRDKEEINAKSILGVASLGAEFGTELTLKIEGEDERDALNVLMRLFEDNFSRGEDS